MGKKSYLAVLQRLLDEATKRHYLAEERLETAELEGKLPEVEIDVLAEQAWIDGTTRDYLNRVIRDVKNW